MSIAGKPLHVCAKNRNDRLCAGISDSGNILYHFCSLFFMRIHEVVNILIKLFDDGIEFIQVFKKKPQHFSLDVGHDSVQVVNDLFLRRLQIMCDDFLFIEDVIFSRINLFAGKDVFKDISGAFYR